MAGWAERMSRHRLTPSPSGSRTSSTATSGSVACNAPNGLAEGPRLADHGEVGLRIDELRDSAPHDLVIVHEEDADHESPIRVRLLPEPTTRCGFPCRRRR